MKLLQLLWEESMKKSISAALFSVALAAGCAQTIGGKAIPNPSAGFQPADPLPYPVAKVYKAAIDTLDDSRIPVANQSKEDGRISTDYIAGPTQIMALGILGSTSTRYKYLISMKDRGHNTKLTVTAYLESSGNKIQSWRDVSADNPQVISSLQNALTEDIEKHLKSAAANEPGPKAEQPAPPAARKKAARR